MFKRIATFFPVIALVFAFSGYAAQPLKQEFIIASKHESLFMGLAHKQTRLNKVQLLKVMTDLHKGNRDALAEVASKLANAYQKILSLRKHISFGPQIKSNCIENPLSFRWQPRILLEAYE